MLGALNSANILSWLATALIAYLIGVIPAVYLTVRWVKGQNIRCLGDRNAGVANAARALGTAAGLAVGAIDIGKGLAAVLLAHWLLDSLVAQMFAGFMVIIGHVWPVFLQGRGGRGAATAVGMLVATVSVVAVPMGVQAVVVLYFFKSPTKVLAVMYIPLPFLAFWTGGYPYPLVFYSLAVPILVGICHSLSLRQSRTSSASGVGAFSD